MLQRLLLISVLTLCSLTSHTMTAHADFAAGQNAYINQEWVKAIRELRPLAEEGHANASFLLGNIYVNGNGVLKDSVTGINLYKNAALAHNTAAMTSIATLYQNGLGVEQDARLASQWFHRAAALGDPVATFFYGLLLLQGDQSGKNRIARNISGAYQWFLIGSTIDTNKNFQVTSKDMAYQTGKRMTPLQRMQIEKKIKSWKPVDPETLGPLPKEVEEIPED